MPKYHVFYNADSKQWENTVFTGNHVGKRYSKDEAVAECEKRNAGETILCLECQRPFSIGKEEQNWYAERNFDKPKRCVGCRKKRRKNAEQTEQNKQ